MIFTTHKRNRYDLFFRPHGRQLLTWLECQRMVGRESVKFNDSTAPQPANCNGTYRNRVNRPSPERGAEGGHNNAVVQDNL